MNINDVINQEVSKIDLESIVKEEINKSLKSLLSKKVNDLFSTYGNIGSQLDEHFKENFKIDFKRIDLHEHTYFVTNCIVKQLAEAFKTEEESIKKLINAKIFTETRSEIPLAVLETEIEDLILGDLNIEKEYYESDCPGVYIDFDVEDDGSFKKIKINIHEDSKRNDTDIMIGLHNGIIYHHRSSIDSIDSFCSVLKYRGTKIITE